MSLKIILVGVNLIIGVANTTYAYLTNNGVAFWCGGLSVGFALGIAAFWGPK